MIRTAFTVDALAGGAANVSEAEVTAARAAILNIAPNPLKRIIVGLSFNRS
jgi:hypothetical protein